MEKRTVGRIKGIFNTALIVLKETGVISQGAVKRLNDELVKEIKQHQKELNDKLIEDIGEQSGNVNHFPEADEGDRPPGAEMEEHVKKQAEEIKKSYDGIKGGGVDD